MPIPNEITDILSEFGLPAGAIALAVGLIRGAKTLEEDASEPALKYVSGLLTGGSVANFGKLGATLIPAIFDRIFGTRPFSFRFILRSFVASALFWLILLLAKHPNWTFVWRDMNGNHDFPFILGEWFLVATVYFLDWISLVKARSLMKIVSAKYALWSYFVYFLLDVFIW